MSEKVGHTPGPWALAPRAKATIRAKSGHSVCDVHWVNRDANARLIAAGPDLLAALKDLLCIAEGEGIVGDTTTLVAAHAIIAKAEGRDNG